MKTLLDWIDAHPHRLRIVLATHTVLLSTMILVLISAVFPLR
jgi:hypothetical protein